MALARTGICHFGWKARDFKLKGVDGKRPTRLPTCAGRRARSSFSSAITVRM